MGVAGIPPMGDSLFRNVSIYVLRRRHWNRRGSVSSECAGLRVNHPLVAVKSELRFVAGEALYRCNYPFVVVSFFESL